jgi:flavodoxin
LHGSYDMKALVVFYSRKGATRNVAEAISKLLKCDIEEIFDTKKRTGVIGYLRSGFDGKFKKRTVIEEVKKNPASYDLVVMGTPIWSSAMSSSIRTYITQNKGTFKNVAFFCTAGSGSNGSSFAEMQSLCEKKPLSLFELSADEVSKGQYAEKVGQFVDGIMHI